MAVVRAEEKERRFLTHCRFSHGGTCRLSQAAKAKGSSYSSGERERRLNKALSQQSGAVQEKEQEAGAHE